MSLIIEFITENEIKIQIPNNGMFGFESWRKSLWGNPIISKFGCEIIPTLHSADIYATDKNLNKLKQELLIIKNNLKEISKHTEIDEESIQFRINNALEFIKMAQEENNIVGIYIG